MGLSQLKRVRWLVRGVLSLGVAASVTANVLHANPNPISQTIAAWPPLALLLTIELISRVPVHRRSLAIARMAATVAIAGIAAWVSYWHMAGVVARYGEIGAAPYLMPFSVDGLVIVASVCLVELAGRIRTLSAEPAAAMVAGPVTTPTPAVTSQASNPPADAIRAAAPEGNRVVKPARPRLARKPVSADKVAKAAARMPGATVAAIAAKAGVSESTARRYLPTPIPAPADATVASPSAGSPAQTPDPANADPVPAAA